VLIRRGDTWSIQDHVGHLLDLDEMHIDRFGDFLAGAPAPVSMEVASHLYGVAMEEKGVSKLVSVELEEVQPEERRAAA
jgi:hypothetical protein